MTAGALFHVARRSLRDDISRYGLSVDAIVDRNHPWCDRGLYFWTTMQAAQEWANSRKRGFLEPADVWEVQPAWDGDVFADGYQNDRPDLPGYAHSVFSVDDVDPDLLRLVPNDSV